MAFFMKANMGLGAIDPVNKQYKNYLVRSCRLKKGINMQQVSS